MGWTVTVDVIGIVIVIVIVIIPYHGRAIGLRSPILRA